MRRGAYGLRQARQAFVQMGEQAVCVQRLEDQPAAQPRLQNVERIPISPENAVPHGIGTAARCALDCRGLPHILDEERGQTRDRVRRWQVCGDDRVRGLELPAGLLLVGEPALVVDELAHRIGEHIGRVRDRGAPDRVHVEHPAVGEWDERVVRVPGERVQLLRSGREEVRAAVAPPGEEAAVFLQDDGRGGRIHYEAPVEQISGALRRSPVLAKAPKGGRCRHAQSSAYRQRHDVHRPTPLRTPRPEMLVVPSPERRSRPRRNRRPNSGRRGVHTGVRRVVVLREETPHVEGAHLWVLLRDPNHRAVHHSEPEESE